MKTEFGFLLAVLGGVMTGTCMMPLNYLRRWRWENAWIIFSLVALVVLPWSIAWLGVPHLGQVYAGIPFRSFVMPFVYGAGWGVAQVLFGLAVVRIGMALAFAVTIGLSAALGTLVPILFRTPEVMRTPRGAVLLAGIGLMAAGVIACSYAGRQREKQQAGIGGTSLVTPGAYGAGIVMAGLAGLFAPMLNYALAFGTTILSSALAQHTAPANAPYAVWPIALAGGAIPNLAYAVYLASTNGTWSEFSLPDRDFLLAALMGILWMGSVAIYGSSTTFLGPFGASIGWSIFQVCIILTANISGWISGEWRNVSRRSRTVLWTGLLLLVCATLAIAFGGH
jgi:L-rhamnose-H+ transport protein